MDRTRVTLRAFVAAELAEYIRLWKLVTFLLGVALLIRGAFYVKAPDWDIGISLVMAVTTYLTAPFSLRTVLEHRWRFLPLMLFLTWFSVDGCYWIYWHFKNPEALHLMRSANFTASLSMYGICGIIWLYHGTLHQLFSELLAHFQSLRKMVS